MDKNYITLLQELIQKAGLSQREIARRLGVTFAALNRWMNRHAKPRLVSLRAIQRLHKEIVGFPSIQGKELQEIIRNANHLKIKGLWKLISSNRRLQDDLVVEHTFNSTSIEGTTFSKEEAETVIFDKAIIPEKSLVEHLEVTQHAAVLRGVFQNRNHRGISEEFFRELHTQLMQGIRDDAGKYSKHYRAIRGVDLALTHPKDIPEEMHQLIQTWEKRRKTTLREIADFHVRFELIHPFGDGNGRIGRLLTVIQCLQHNFPPVIIETSRKAEYYETLGYAQRASDGPFIRFLAEEMLRTREKIKKYI